MAVLLRRWVAMAVAVAFLCPGGASGAKREATLIDAIRDGDRTALRALLATSDVNAPAVDGSTALHWAARQEDAEAVEWLLSKGAHVQAANRYGITPLWLAAQNGNATIVRQLLDAGADPNMALPEGDTVLMNAARSGKAAAVRVLLAAGAAVNAQESVRGQTALMWAAADNRADVVKTLIEAGAEVSARSTGEGGFTPLLFAARENSIDALRLLLEHGADADEALSDGTAALGLAVSSANYELAAVLLDHGADPNNDAPGWTPLHRITWLRRPYHGTNNPFPVTMGAVDSITFVRQLVAHGANVNARLSKTPDAKYVGRDVNIDAGRALVGATPFFLAARNDDVPLMKELLALGADAFAPNDEGTTPLMAAAGVSIRAKGENPGTDEEAREAVAFMLGLGGDPTTVDANGNTALHGAALRGAPETVRVLVDAGAKLDVKNNQGWTPWRVAAGVVVNITVMRNPETEVVLRELMTARGMTISPDEPEVVTGKNPLGGM
ncbi:MAG: hypothetical protein FJW23_08415 [Acidimicrobiia bacterium]|nr:hypothetical protein [Acidimicrobiia bacterium]